MTDCKGAGPELAATDPGAQKNVGSGKSRSSKPQPSDPQAAPKSWRDVLPVHPAADLFPLMAPDELKALGEDIKKNGLHVPFTIVEWQKHFPDAAATAATELDALSAAGLDRTACERWNRWGPENRLIDAGGQPKYGSPMGTTEVRGRSD